MCKNRLNSQFRHSSNHQETMPVEGGKFCWKIHFLFRFRLAKSLDYDVNMDHRQERMRVECRKIIDSINSMSFTNLDDQRVHSLMMIREIARGVVNNRVEKVID